MTLLFSLALRPGNTKHGMHFFINDLDLEGFNPHQMSVTENKEQLGCVEQEET